MSKKINEAFIQHGKNLHISHAYFEHISEFGRDFFVARYIEAIEPFAEDGIKTDRQILFSYLLENHNLFSAEKLNALYTVLCTENMLLFNHLPILAEANSGVQVGEVVNVHYGRPGQYKVCHILDSQAPGIFFLGCLLGPCDACDEAFMKAISL